MTTTITIATQTPQGATVTASKSTEDDEAARLLVQRARNYNRDLKAQEAVADEPGITLG